MKNLIVGILLFLFFLPFLGIAQFPYYKNLNINDGLASNKIYNIIEDRLGFIWICTDQGVSRYDGIKFHNYNTKDGLPDNEVLSLFEDSVGRIWFNGFSTEPCYYFKGKIHNASNDSFLNRIRKNKLPGVCSNVIIQWNNSIAYIIQEKGRKLLIGKDIKDIELKTKVKLQEFVYQHILIRTQNKYKMVSDFSVLEWKLNDSVHNVKLFGPGYKFNYFKAPTSKIYSLSQTLNKLQTIALFSNDNSEIKVDQEYKNLFYINNQVVLTSEKSYTIYNSDFTKILEKVNLPFHFERICIDSKGNKWFGSFDKGLYLVRSQAPNFIDLFQNRNEGIISIVPDGDRLVINTEKNGLLTLDESGLCQQVLMDPLLNRMKGYARIGEYGLLGTDNGLYLMNRNLQRIKLLKYSAIKDVELINKDEIIVGFSSGACLYQKRFKDSVLIFEFERTTAVCRKDSNSIWLGGLNGVRVSTQIGQKFKTKKLKLNTEIDNSRIVDIKRDDDGNMWIATDQNGLFCYLKNGSILKFSEASQPTHQLLSNVCLQICIDPNNRIWLATLNGISIINKIDAKPSYAVQNYTLSDGMPGKTIKNIAFWNQGIWVVTAQGLFVYTGFPNSQSQTSKTIITGIKVNNVFYDDSTLKLSHKENNLLISYAASFVNTNSEYQFRYRIKELSKEWNITKNLEVPLLGIDPGSYTFEIAAINAHGITGQTTALQFVIQQPWYNTPWFKVLIALVVLAILFYLYQSAKSKINMGKNLSLFRLRIMRAQMNPHFVFNALSNIQHLVQTKELKQADDYIVTLASIMRKSIDYSGQEFITLEKEIDYTQNYLEIEKQRFEDKFDYEISSKLIALEEAQIFVPPLILQPLVENAIKHAFKEITKKGLIKIEILKPDENTLRYVINDNGKGFEYVPNTAINHGLDITKERLSILYNEMKKKVKFTIESKSDKQSHGTTITIEIPILKD